MTRGGHIAVLICMVASGCSGSPTPEAPVQGATVPVNVIAGDPSEPVQRFARDRIRVTRQTAAPTLELPLDATWNPFHDAAIELSDNSLVLKPSGRPAFMQLPITADTEAYCAFEVEMRVSAGAKCQFKWATANAPDFAKNHGVFEPIIADGAFHTYTFDLTHHTLVEWVGRLTAIEFWPSDTEATAEIRAVRLVGAAPTVPRRVTLLNQTHEAVFGMQPEWRVQVPENGVLSVYSGMLHEAASRYGSDGAEVRASIKVDGKAQGSFSGIINPTAKPSERGWRHFTADLSPYSGKEIEITFDVDSLGSPVGDFVFWGSPIVFSKTPAEKNAPVIFISLDTLRADHLSAYGYERETSPNIDRLAADAVLFEHAITPETWTLPSHMTMFTGLYPKSHGVTGNALLPESRLTLGDALSDAGYLTAGFTGLDWWLMPYRGFAQGFDIYNHARPSFRHIYDTMPLVDEWLHRHNTGRFFLFFHAFDIHSKVDSMEEFILPYETGDPAMHHFSADLSPPTFEREGLETRATHYLRRGNEGTLTPTQEELDYMIAVYDDCIRMVDMKIGELFDSLRERGLYDQALIVLLSDHGESFFEHDRFLHTTVYEENCHVPLIVKLPKNKHAGKRIADQVVLTDVLPTILDVLDIEMDAEFDGQSLLPMIEGAAANDPVIYVQREEQRGIRTNNLKSIRYTDGREEEWYDLLADPNETDPAGDRVPGAAESLASRAHEAFFAVPSGGWHIAFTAGDAAWSPRVTFAAESRVTRVAFEFADRRDESFIVPGSQSDTGFVANVTLSSGAEELCTVGVEDAAPDEQQSASTIPDEVREQLEAIGYGAAEIEAAIASGRAQLTIESEIPFRVNGSGESVTTHTEMLDPLDPQFMEIPIATTEDGPSVRIWYSPPSVDDRPRELTLDELRALGNATVIKTN